MQLQAKQTAELIEKYGKAAAVALSARRVQTADIAAVLEKEPKLSDRFYELVMEAERKVLKQTILIIDHLSLSRICFYCGYNSNFLSLEALILLICLLYS